LPSGPEIKRKRLVSGISALVLSAKSGVNRSQLSLIENGHVVPSAKQLGRIGSALDELITAKRLMSETALEHGWPMSAL
jgi:transcriptional regulator with XRE-family HTH domain